MAMVRLLGRAASRTATVFRVKLTGCSTEAEASSDSLRGPRMTRRRIVPFSPYRSRQVWRVT